MGEQRADESRRAAEDCHALALDELPEPVGGLVRCALREDEAAAHGAASNHGPRAHDPTHVRREEDDIVLARVRLVGDLARDRDEEAALHMEHALRLAGRPGRVGQEIGMLGVDLERGELTGAEVDPIPGAVLPAPRDDVLDRGRVRDRLGYGRLHVEPLTAAQGAVGGEDDLRLGILQTLGHRRCREPGENRHLDGSDVGAGVGGHRDLRAHGHVDRDAVAGLDA
jgi:hypothetical protein